jgi:hypothetical protein
VRGTACRRDSERDMQAAAGAVALGIGVRSPAHGWWVDA